MERNKRKLQIASAVFIIIALLLATAGCGQPTEKGPAPESSPITLSKIPDHLRLPGGEPLTLDPHRVTDAGSHAYVGKIFSGLLKLNLVVVDKQNNVVGKMGDWAKDREMTRRIWSGEWSLATDEKNPVLPDIAENVPAPEFNQDGTVSYTFRIRDEARFASGLEVTAYHFIYSIERAADPRTRSTTAEMYLGDIVGVQDMLRRKIPNRISQDPDIAKEIRDLPGLEALDKKTLRITIDSFKPYFLMKLTYPTAFVVDKVQAESVANWLDRPNGTGAFRMTERIPGVKLMFEPNQYYHGYKATLAVEYFLTGGASYPRYKQNELDMATIGLSDLEVLSQARNPKSELGKLYYQNVEMSTSYLGLNTTKPPFDDPLVRKAFAMAIDKDTLAGNVLYDLVLPAHGVLPPGMPGYRKDYQGSPFDPKTARELLKQSKYGGSEKLGRIKLLVSGSGGQEPITLQSITEMWRMNLGVEVEFEQIDYATFLEEISKGEFQIFSLGWVADYPDPEDFLDLKFYWPRSRANNETGYNNPEVNRLLLQARIEQNQAKRIDLYQRAEDVIVEETPWIILFHGRESMIVSSYVCGYVPSPMGIPILHYVTFCNQPG